jgi:hypothetical protein
LVCSTSEQSDKERSRSRLAVLVSEHGKDWRLRLELNTSIHGPQVQPLGESELLVVSGRSRRALDGSAEENARVFDSQGREVGRFVAGDGIEHVQTTTNGEIWIGYSDDGVVGAYGRYGWGRLSPEEWIDPIGISGLVQFDSFGRRLYEFSPPLGEHVMCDCYCLNVTDQEVWTSYHPGFPLVSITSDRRSTAWKTGLSGIGAVAVFADAMLLFVGVNRPRKLLLARIGPVGLENILELDPALDDSSPISDLRWLVGRGKALYGFSSTSWYELRVPDVVATLARQ